MNTGNTVQVWDILVRIFHWSLVTAFAIAYFTSEDDNIWHIYSGYVVLGLIVFRVVWGFIGTRHARFSDFVYSPGAVFKYIRELASGHPPRYLGHNPPGGWMICALLAGLTVITVSGLKVYAIEEGRGPLARADSEFSIITNSYADQDEDEKGEERRDREVDEQEEEFWEEIHEVSTNVTLLLILLHIVGVIVSNKLHNENLVKAMITGRKRA